MQLGSIRRQLQGCAQLGNCIVNLAKLNVGDGKILMRGYVVRLQGYGPLQEGNRILPLY